MEWVKRRLNYGGGMQVKLQLLCFLAGLLSLSITACGISQNQASTPPGRSSGGKTDLKGSQNVLADGSGTVFLITKEMKAKFKTANPAVRVAAGSSGTGDGFKRLCSGKIDISLAARPIKKSEIETCQKNQIEFVELPIAFDGITIIANPANTWTTCFKPEELGKIWDSGAEGKIVNWKQVRNDYPDRPLLLAGPGAGSGSIDYLIEVTVGKEGKIRSDYQSSQEETVTIQTIASDAGGLGFTAFSHYIKNKSVLKSVAIENKEGKCVEPSTETIADGSYSPLARPLFIYVSEAALKENSAVKAFAKYHIDATNRSLVSKAGYVPLSEDLLAKLQIRLDKLVTGSLFNGGSAAGVKLADKLATSQQQ